MPLEETKVLIDLKDPPAMIRWDIGWYSETVCRGHFMPHLDQDRENPKVYRYRMFRLQSIAPALEHIASCWECIWGASAAHQKTAGPERK